MKETYCLCVLKDDKHPEDALLTHCSECDAEVWMAIGNAYMKAICGKCCIEKTRKDLAEGGVKREDLEKTMDFITGKIAEHAKKKLDSGEIKLTKRQIKIRLRVEKELGQEIYDLAKSAGLMLNPLKEVPRRVLYNIIVVAFCCALDHGQITFKKTGKKKVEGVDGG